MVTRRLWMAIGIHLAWNYMQGGLFGISVSGTERQGFFSSQLSDPAWLSGGNFGVEASVVTVVLCLLVAVWFVSRARQKRFIVAPSWQRQNMNTNLG